MVGRALQEQVNPHSGEHEWFFLSSQDVDLLCIDATRAAFAKFRPTHVLHLAARVGGLFANMEANMRFFTDNVKINQNVLQCCKEFRVAKVVSCLSTCVFPDNCADVLDETMLHDGLPHGSNMGYSFAKRMIDVHNRLNTNPQQIFTSVIPTNIFGQHDNFSLTQGHVIPALIHKCLLAKRSGGPFWVMGSGTPVRQFVFSRDIAKLLIRVINEYDDPSPIILAPDLGSEMTIGDAARAIARALDYQGDITFDPSQSDGQHKKTASNRKLRKLFANFEFTPFEEAIALTCDWFKTNFDKARGVATQTPTQPPTKKRVALITGITGQDGSYLAEFLLDKGYEVHGIIRRASSFNTSRIDHIYHQLHLHHGDLTDANACFNIISRVRPDELYNLGAQSHVKVSFDMPEYTANADAIGVLRILDAVRAAGLAHRTRVYQASTSELFGKVQEVPQRETTPFYPRSPYAVAKQYAFWTIKNYREAYGMHLSNGILFNHESPRRGETFVTRKVTIGVAKIHLGLCDCLHMGDLNSKRDWGHAKEYVQMMWLMLQQSEPDDYVAATGKSYSIRHFIEIAFRAIDVEIRWRGKGVDEVGYDSRNPGRVLVRVNPRYFRPSEVEHLIGDPSKAERVLGWKAKTGIEDLCKEMVEADIAVLRKSAQIVPPVV